MCCSTAKFSRAMPVVSRVATSTAIRHFDKPLEKRSKKLLSFSRQGISAHDMNHKNRATARKKSAHYAFLWMWILLLVAPACRTVPRLAPVDFNTQEWHVQQGQAVWKTKKDAPELAGDLLIGTNRKNGRTIVQFTKTPIPFVIAQTTTNSWQIEIPVQKKFYSGYGKPPGRLAWFFVPQVLNGAPPPKNWSLDRSGTSWTFRNAKTGETIEGFLEP